MLTSHTYADMQWVDIVDPTEDDLRQARDTYHLATHAFEEANRRAPRPTMQRFVDHAYVVAFSGTLAEIDMYIGPTWLVTVRRHDPEGREWDPSAAMQRFARRCGDAPDSGRLLLTILDELIDGYFDATDRIELQIEDLEERIFDGEPAGNPRVQQDLFQIRRQLLELRRVVMPLREVLGSIARMEVPWINGEAIVQCRDSFDKLLRAVDVVDEQRELIGNAVDAHLAVTSNQMNLVMKKLTAYGSIVFGATLIAGIYGMNFEHMPELHWRYGYAYAIGMMFVISGLLYRMFRRRDWL